MPAAIQPGIITFKGTPEEVMADETVLLDWEVVDAREVYLDGFLMDAKQTYKVSVSNNRLFELKAVNRKETVYEYVEIRLLKPETIRFDTTSNTIIEGQPVEVFFQVKNAHAWQLIAEYDLAAGFGNETLAGGKIENGRALFEHKQEFYLKYSCTLRLILLNGFLGWPSETIQLYKRKLRLELYADHSVVKQGNTVRLTWIAENANVLYLNPGNIDVTGLPYYDFVVNDNRDILFE